MLIGGDWGGGNPDKGLVTNPSAKLENFAIADRDHREHRREHHHQRVGHRARQRRQGRAVVRQPDHLCRNNPRPRRHARAATAVSWRRRATASSLIHRQCQCWRAERHSWNAAARSRGHFDRQRGGQSRISASSAAPLHQQRCNSDDVNAACSQQRHVEWQTEISRIRQKRRARRVECRLRR